MKTYLFDEKTKEYIGSEEALFDPLETKNRGEPVWLLPANATFDMPPVAEAGKTLIFENGWKQVVDNRGKKAINIDRGIFKIDYIGERESDVIITEEMEKGLDDGTKIIRDGRIIDKPKADKAEEKRALRDSYLNMTDKFMLDDYPIDENERNKYKLYRQYLRDIPSAKEFPDVEILPFESWAENLA